MSDTNADCDAQDCISRTISPRDDSGAVLTPRQRLILRRILSYYLFHGMPPNLKDLQLRTGIGRSLTKDLRDLAVAGYLAFVPGPRNPIRLAGVEWHPVFDSTTPAGLLLAELYREIKGTTRTPYLVEAGVLQ